MASLADIREGLKARLDTIPDVQTSAYMLAPPTPPAMHIVPAAMEYDVAFQRGLDRLTLTVQGFVPLTADIGAQKKLDGWLAAEGSESVKNAIEGDKTLGGVVSDLRVIRHGGYQSLLVEGRAPMLMAEWTVQVLAPSS